jgi:glycosyltransferase involved in cell wall biosynthesis
VRILFVNSAWPPSWGGGEKWTVEAAEWFRDNGHDVMVVGRPRSKLVAAATGRGLLAKEHHFRGDVDPWALHRARRLLAGFRPDLVVVNFNKEAWQFGIPSKRLGIPVIARHGFPLFRPSLHHRRLATSILTRLVVNARSIRDEYASLGFDMSRTVIIHNGVKPIPQRSGELRRRFEISPDDLLVLAAGRVESQKRFDQVISAAAELVLDRPQLRFLIAGDGPLRLPLMQRVKERGLENRILMPGFIPDLSELMADASLFLLTSDNEGTPNVLLEAMAAGTACIAFAVGAVPELLNGTLSENAIQPGNLAALMQRASELLDDNELRSAVGLQMKAHAQDEFAFSESMRRFAELFQDTIQSKR